MLRIIPAVLLALLIPAAAQADATVVWKAQTKKVNKFVPARNVETEMIQTVMFKGKMVRIDTKDSKAYTVTDFEKGLHYAIDPTAKTVSRISFDDLGELRNSIFHEIRTQLGQLEKLTPEQKAGLEIALGPMFAKWKEDLANKDKKTRVETKELEESKEIAGHTCRHVVIEEEGQVVVDVWLTDKIELEVKLAEMLSSITPFSESVKAEIKKLKGFSLQTTWTVRLFGEIYSNSTETAEVKTEDLPAEKFAIPEDYKEVESQQAEYQSIRRYKKWKKAQAQKAAGKKEPDQEKEQEPAREPEKSEPAPPPEGKDPGEDGSD